MPRVHRITPAPGAGDCFFHVVAYFIGRKIDSVGAAGEARAAVAKGLARDLFQPPYNNILTLSELVLHARTDTDLDVVQLQDTDDARHLVALRPGAGVGARNGELVPLPAWVVWLQFDVEQIAALTHMRDRAPVGLRAGGFLSYTLWGDAALCAEIVHRLSGRPVAIYLNTQEQLGLINPINILYVGNHFDAIEFIDVSEAALSELFTEQALQGAAQSCGTLPECAQVYATLKPSSLGASSSSGKAQYADPGIVVPGTFEERLALCRCLLRGRAKAMPFAYKAQLVKDGSPAKAAHGSLAPIYVITSNRARWLYSVRKVSLLMLLASEDRPVIFTAGEGELEAYAPLSELPHCYVLSCPGGFGIGWNRYCAVRHARAAGANRVWLLDDNVETLRPALDDRQMREWHGEDEEVFPYYSFFTGIMQQAVGLDLELLATLPGHLGQLNFCPYFVYSKEDLSLSLVFDWLIHLNYGAGWRHPYNKGRSVTKVDKATIKLDIPGTRPERADWMGTIAELPVWRYRGSAEEDEKAPTKNHNLSDTVSNSYLVMKYQEQLLYNCISDGPLGLEVLIALVQEGWFSDSIA